MASANTSRGCTGLLSSSPMVMTRFSISSLAPLSDRHTKCSRGLPAICAIAQELRGGLRDSPFRGGSSTESRHSSAIPAGALGNWELPRSILPKWQHVWQDRRPRTIPAPESCHCGGPRQVGHTAVLEMPVQGQFDPHGLDGRPGGGEEGLPQGRCGDLVRLQPEPPCRADVFAQVGLPRNQVNGSAAGRNLCRHGHAVRGSPDDHHVHVRQHRNRPHRLLDRGRVFGGRDTRCERGRESDQNHPGKQSSHTGSMVPLPPLEVKQTAERRIGSCFFGWSAMPLAVHAVYACRAQRIAACEACVTIRCNDGLQ